MRFDVVAVVAVDQHLHAGIPVLTDQVDCLGDRADKTPQRPARGQPLTLRPHGSIASGEQSTVVVRLFNRIVITLCGIAMAAKHRKLVPHRVGIAADIAGIGQASDRA